MRGLIAMMMAGCAARSPVLALHAEPSMVAREGKCELQVQIRNVGKVAVEVPIRLYFDYEQCAMRELFADVVDVETGEPPGFRETRCQHMSYTTPDERALLQPGDEFVGQLDMCWYQNPPPGTYLATLHLSVFGHDAKERRHQIEAVAAPFEILIPPYVPRSRPPIPPPPP